MVKLIYIDKQDAPINRKGYYQRKGMGTWAGFVIQTVHVVERMLPQGNRFKLNRIIWKLSMLLKENPTQLYK